MQKRLKNRGTTLVETMLALFLMATVLLGILGSFLQSRRITENALQHAAATSFVYGIVEQLKTIPYESTNPAGAPINVLPATTVDPSAPTAATLAQPTVPTPPYVRVRLNQDDFYWLQVVYTPAPALPALPTPAAPAGIPPLTVSGPSLGAIDNIVKVRLSQNQDLNINFWVWIDEIPDPTNDVLQVKKITMIYTYEFNDGRGVRLIRDREVIIRTRFQN